MHHNNGVIRFRSWDFIWKISSGKIVDTSFHKIAKRSKTPDFPFYNEFALYFRDGYFKHFPEFEIRGVSENQKKLLMTLHGNWDKILYYGELAEKAGFPKAGRFAGTCMAKNPLPLIIPCHHVIGRSDPWKFTGPRELKEALLDLEGKLPLHTD